MLIAIHENLAHSSNVVIVADFFGWPFTHQSWECKLVQSDTWNNLEFKAREGFSASPTITRGLSHRRAPWLSLDSCVHISGSWWKVPGRVWLQCFLMQWAWAAPSTTCTLLPSFTHSSLLIFCFYPAAPIFCLYSSSVLWNHFEGTQTVNDRLGIVLIWHWGSDKDIKSVTFLNLFLFLFFF